MRRQDKKDVSLQGQSRNNGNDKTKTGGAAEIIGGSLFKTIFFIFIFMWAVGAVYMISTLDGENAERQRRIDDKNAELSRLSMEQLELERYLTDEHLPEYMEQIARNELNYANPNERIYYIINE